MNTLFVDHLTVIDASYLDPSRGIVGESWIVDITLSGELDEQGMVFDFGHVKKRIKDAIDASMDHTLIVPERMPALLLRDQGDSFTLEATLQDGGNITMSAPREAIYVLPAAAVTAEAMTETLTGLLHHVVPDNVSDIGLTLRHEAIEGPYFHYSHGLKHHEGNCQRIAHGHRSRLQVWRNGEEDRALAQSVTDSWRDIYLVTREDIVPGDDPQTMRVAYQARQGEFSLSLPASCCAVLDTDSTVELIAEHLAQGLAQEHPGERIRVKAYEGVNKGAVAEAGG